MVGHKKRGWVQAICPALLVPALLLGGSVEAAEPPTRTYVGAPVCGTCHLGKHETWSQTAHQQILRNGSLESSYINDADNSGRSDFFDGSETAITELPGGDAFADLGANAPVLGKSDQLGPLVQIGGTKYAIAYTIGGSAVQNPTVADEDMDGKILNSEAQWKQLYITKIGASHYVLPLQFNAKTGEYVPYNLSEWYDVDNLPIAETDLESPETAYERRCAGCHSTGVEVALNANGLWTMTFADMNVACEACHGPGSDHVLAPTVALKKATIVNPATLWATTDLNDDNQLSVIDDLIAQNNVCYQCHQQGTGNYGEGDGALLYPSKTKDNGEPLLFQIGQVGHEDLRGFFTISQNPNYYWGAHDANGNGMIDLVAQEEVDSNGNGILDPEEDLNHNGLWDAEKEFIAAAFNSQQGQDHANGPHAADKPYDHPCFVCHDMHKADNVHLVTANLEGIPTDTGRNTLCLICHATHGPFADLTEDDVQSDPDKVATVVKAHVKSAAFMEVGFETRCTSCHMPPTGKSAIEPAIVLNRFGQPEEVRGGDLHSHTFEPIWPGFVMQPEDFQWTDFLLVDGFQVGPMPDSCTSCHAHDPNGGSDNIVTQWAFSGHADGYGEPFNHWNAEGEVSSSCSRCHSQGGFKQLADSSDPVTGIPEYTLDSNNTHPDFTAVTAHSAIYPKVLNCNTCHEENGGGETVYDAGKVQQVAFPSGDLKTLGDSSNICMQCHQGRESGLSVEYAAPGSNGYYRFINRHYFAEAAIFFGSEVHAGYEYPGKTYAEKNGFRGHEQVQRQNCIQCHLNVYTHEIDPVTGEEIVEKDHDFFPNIEDCSGCHLAADGWPLEDFDDLGRPFGFPNVDYDGSCNGAPPWVCAGDSFRHEIDGMQAKLILVMNQYAYANGLDPIMYTPGGYPYFFTASCYEGIGGCTDPVPAGSYSTFDKPLLAAAYNYHCAQDPGSGIHNYRYVMQTVYDSILNLGGAPGYMKRPN